MAARTRRRDSSGHIDPHFARRRRYEAVLGALGVAKEFSRQSRHVQELFWQRKMPDPEIEFEESFTSVGAAHRALRKVVEASFRKAWIDVDGERIAMRDFFSVVLGRFLVVDQTREDEPGMPEEVVRFVQTARPQLQRVRTDFMFEAIKSLYYAVHVPLLEHSRLETRLLTARLDDYSNSAGKTGARVIVGAVVPEVRKVALDGAPRPMYRVGRTGAAGASASEADAAVEWVSWDGAVMDAAAAGKMLPVYVQSHALRQLQSRVNLPRAEPYLQAWLAESLAAPCVVEREGNGNLLVEYRIKDSRLGYLVVTPLDDLVVVRTFLFLTMEQTPEARMLRSKLRLTRRDLDWLGLSDLAAFTQTDLRDDPALRAMLETCGCGHLFALAEDGGEGNFTPEPKALAAEMRKYLRMAE